MALSLALAFGLTVAFTASVICIILAAELVWPREEHIPLRQRLTAIGFGMTYAVVAILCVPLTSIAMTKLGAKPLIPGIGLLDAVIAALVADFFYYWFHRAEHSIGWLWRIHAVHHSAEHLSAGTGYHHLSEAPLRALAIGVPATLLFGGAGGALAMLFGTFHAFYIHSMTRLNLGPLAWFLADNRVHRIHHSREERHFDKNFGALTMAWDKIFGTAHFPRPGEWPKIGLADVPEPKTLREYLMQPWPGRSDRPSVTTVPNIQSQ